MQKHKESKFLYPCSDALKTQKNTSLEESGLSITKAALYKVACSDLSDLSDVKYDVLVFFSPTGIKSLLTNFPKFEQAETRLAVFGSSTIESVEKNNLRVDIAAPTKKAPSMSMALDQYIKEQINEGDKQPFSYFLICMQTLRKTEIINHKKN